MHLPKFFLCDQSWIIWEYCVAKVTVEIFTSQILLVTKVSLNIFPIRDLFKGRQGPLDGRLLQPVQKFRRASPLATRDHATAGLFYSQFCLKEDFQW